MPFEFAQIYIAMPAFLLVTARITGLMLAAPLFSAATVPTTVKALFVAAISLAVFPLLVPAMQGPLTMGATVAGLIGELAIGLMLGLGVSLILAGVQLGVQTVSQQAGLALGEVFDPTMETSTPIAAEIYFYVCMTVFLAVGGHRALVRGLLDSFATIPPMGFRVTEDVVALLIEMLTVSFIIAVRVGGPIILALLLAFVTLGFISRTIPQLHLMTVGFPVKIALALGLMAMTLMSLEPVMVDSVNRTMDDLRMGLGIGRF
jgi:flagellar biosynthetic protein FliR